MNVPFISSAIKNPQIKKIVANVGVVLSGNFIATALNLVSFTIMANCSGPTTIAILTLAQTYSMIVNDIFNIQTWESMVKFGAIDSANKKKTVSVIQTNSLLDIGSAMVATVFALLLVNSVAQFAGWEDSYLDIITLYSFSILFNITSLTIGVPRLFNRFSILAKISIFMACLRLCGVSLAAFLHSDIRGYIMVFLVLNILANLATIIFSTTLLRSHFGRGWWRVRLNIDKEQLRFIWWTNLRTMIRIPVRYFDIIVISSVISMEMVGIYRVYKEIAGIFQRVGEPVNQVIYPEYTSLISQNRSREAAKAATHAMLLLTLLGTLLVLFILPISHPIVRHFFGQEYLSQMFGLYGLIILYGISFALVPANSLFIAAGFAKYSFWLVLFTNSVYLLAVFGLGKWIGLYGIIVAYGIQMLLNSGLKIFFLSRSIDDWGKKLR